MGQLVRIQSGNWKKSLSGNWQFEGDPSEVEHYIVAQNNEKIESFTSLIREELVIEPECPIALTYQLPDAMLQGIVSNSQPANIITSEDVEVVMSVQEWTKGVLLCITYGSLNVARYEFLCRTPFIVGNTTYLDGTVSEEVHVANIKGMVGNDVIMCSETLLRHLMSDEMLFLLYRFSFEVEKARGFPLWQGASYENNPDESEGDASDGSTYFKSDWQECEVGPEYWENVSNRNYNQGEAQSETGDGQAGGNCANRDVIMNDEVTVDATPNVVEVDNSSTGSTSNCNQRKPGDTLYNPINVTVADENNEGNNLRQETYITKDTRVSGGEVGGEPSYVHVTDDSDIPAVTIPVGRERLIIDESSSEIEANEGANNPDVVNVGMIFKCREDFKQHMAMYAIRNKFRFRNSRSAPGGMVRKVNLAHSCSVDDRSGYQSQATTTVIGGMMRGKFAGRGGGPRPNEIREAMQGDHEVHISYWKAWRSREVALDYAKGSCGASYNLLPAYLEKLVHANPGSIADIHTEYAEGIGHRFKYMFLAMSASIEGYKF
ncbi:unnamed protein product, partial [Brassica rapa subsp. trilocularis]